MTTKCLAILVCCILVSGVRSAAQCNGLTQDRFSNVTILPIDNSTNSLSPDAYYVSEFEDLRSNINRSRLFGRLGKARVDNRSYYAAHVPYGRYWIKLQKKSGSDSFGRLIDVCQTDQTVEVSRQVARVHIVPLIVGSSSVKNDSSNVSYVKQFTNRLDKTDMSSLFHEAYADQVPYGQYDLELGLSLIEIKRQVDVFQPDVWVFVGSTGYYGDSDISSPGNIVRGELKNIPPNERPVFMIMSGIYIPYTIDSVLSDTDNGASSFSFVGDNPGGEFMVYTIGKSGVLDAREISIPRDLQIVIDLSRPSSPKISRLLPTEPDVEGREHHSADPHP